MGLTEPDLAAIRAVVRAEWRLLLAELRAGPRDAADVQLFLAIARSTVGMNFTVAELLARHKETSPELAAALDNTDVENGRQLGKFLARLEGRCFEGWQLQRVADDRDGIVWRFVRVSQV